MYNKPAAGKLLVAQEAPLGSVMARGMGREGRAEGTCLCLQVIHTVVQQKPAEHCKAIILQLNK